MERICNECDHRLSSLIGSDPKPVRSLAQTGKPIASFQGLSPKAAKKMALLMGKQTGLGAYEDKAAITAGRIAGRSTTHQHEMLQALGVPRDRSIHWTRYRAMKEIMKRQNKQARVPSHRAEQD